VIQQFLSIVSAPDDTIHKTGLNLGQYKLVPYVRDKPSPAANGNGD